MSQALVACHGVRRRQWAAPVRPGAPDGGEEHADDLNVDVQVDHVVDVQDVVLAEGENDNDDVEDDGEDEVEDGDPKQRLQAARIRICETQTLVEIREDSRHSSDVPRPPLVKTLPNSPCLFLKAWALFNRRRNSTEAYLRQA